MLHFTLILSLLIDERKVKRFTHSELTMTSLTFMLP